MSYRYVITRDLATLLQESVSDLDLSWHPDEVPSIISATLDVLGYRAWANAIVRDSLGATSHSIRLDDEILATVCQEFRAQVLRT